MCNEKSDFTVDLANRRVTHKSGAEATFYEYPTEEDWRASDVITLVNPSRYDGPQGEFALLAKEAALRAGMKSHKP